MLTTILAPWGDVERTKAFVGCEDDPLLLTGDTIDFEILIYETFELFDGHGSTDAIDA
jgi:hypothetical protein